MPHLFLAIASFVPDPLAGYPTWAVIAAGIVLAGVVLWILAKLLKLALWLLVFALIAAALAAAWRLLFH